MQYKTSKEMIVFLICKSFRKKIDLQKLLDLTLWNHIMNNKPNMEYLLTLHKIE